jgi:flagellar biosynthesis chaperone FliJ
MKDIQEDLKNLKDNIDNAKTNLAKLEGRESELLKQLKKDFGVNTVEEAEKKIAQLEKEYKKKKESIEKDYKTLKEQYDW